MLLFLLIMNKKYFFAMFLLAIFIYGCGPKTPEVTGATVLGNPYHIVVLSDDSIKRGVELANPTIGFTVHYGECGSLSSLIREYGAIGLIGSCPDAELTVPIVSITGSDDIFVPESIMGRQFEEQYRKKYNEDPTEKSAEAFDAVLRLFLAIENSDGSSQGVLDSLETVEFTGAH